MTTAWYIIDSDKPGVKWVNLLHWPYLLWHLSYPAIGAALVSDLDLVVLGWTVLAFFLGMGIAGHAFDLLKGDPLKLGIPPRALHVVGFSSLILAVAIGGWQIAIGNVTYWMILALPVGGVLAVGYGLEVRRLHGDWQFAAWWGMFPLLVGYFAQDVSWNPVLIPGVLFAYLSSDAQRAMSTRSRYLRRKVGEVSVKLQEKTSHPGYYRWKNEGKSWELLPLDRALQLLSFALPVMAVTLILIRR